ncbi:hypothetical protein EZ428_03350 [Pedobacter frigiditerrae]|uniref:DUF6265 domain-containing protein n=1 Tax=Pedobacter frigiditerrae TaxID=2530452 RepID=A0A4R0N250_9SPHI|nr:DUF6265 family protein [Pedobacter frigiditerrae]TCC93820.1 hypothetical protein EZ428_03350 [Pedobacter frigiditerrae]
MKKYLILLAFIFIVQLSANAQNKSIKQFNFMLGSWEMKTAKGKITETWLKYKDSLIGKSYRHNLKGDSVLTETLVIKKIDGNFYYCSKVSGQNDNQTIKFKLLPVKENTFIFENPSHDFPQRIVYQNKAKDELLAWVEGEKNGKKGKSEFNYLRRK